MAITAKQLLEELISMFTVAPKYKDGQFGD